MALIWHAFSIRFQSLSEVVLNASWLDLGPYVRVMLGVFFRGCSGFKLRCSPEVVCASLFDRFLVDVAPPGTAKKH